MSARTAEPAAERIVARWPAVRPFAAVGSVSTVVGGVTAAVSRPLGFELGPWLAAFLVLVGGVAQIALGIGQAKARYPKGFTTLKPYLRMTPQPDR